MTQELRKLAEAATQGEWHQTPTSGIYQGRMIVTDDRAACIGETHNANATENAAYIAAASPAAILELLDRVEKAEKDAARLDWMNLAGNRYAFDVAGAWYSRKDRGSPYTKHKTIRAAIDAARAKEQTP
jgi:hypothetical protein